MNQLPRIVDILANPSTFCDAIVAYDRLETLHRTELRFPKMTDNLYIDTVYFVDVFRSENATSDTLDLLFTHPHVGTYMRRVAYYILHTWRVAPSNMSISFDQFLILYKAAPLFNDTDNLRAIEYWFTDLINEPLTTSLERFDRQRAMRFPIREVIRTFRDPRHKSLALWAWDRRQEGYTPHDVYQASLWYIHSPEMFLWEHLSRDTDIFTYISAHPDAWNVADQMRVYRRRRWRAAFRAVWAGVVMWRLYQSWVFHPDRLHVTGSSVYRLTAPARQVMSATPQEESSSMPTIPIRFRLLDVADILDRHL